MPGKIYEVMLACIMKYIKKLRNLVGEFSTFSFALRTGEMLGETERNKGSQNRPAGRLHDATTDPPHLIRNRHRKDPIPPLAANRLRSADIEKRPAVNTNT